MAGRLLMTSFLQIIATFLWAQNFTISGYITDIQSGENLIAANVIDLRTQQGAVANTYGFYSLTLPSDTVELIFSYIGFEPVSVFFHLERDTTVNIALQTHAQLATVEVTGERYDRIEERTQMSQVEIPIAQIKKIPALLGEVDVLKALQLLPGVQSGGEGQNGLYVRGGSPDQNLVLLDGVPVYNVSHLLGIFSVFNADAIKNVTLTKGGFPARYGGRLSSVMEINMKEGNLQEWHGEGAVGLISSKLTLEGPLRKNSTSLLLSARRTYADLIFRPIVKANQGDGGEVDPKLYFYDFNAKLQHKLNERHRLFLSTYLGSDVFKTRYTSRFEDGGKDAFEGGIDWGNIISALRWNWMIDRKLFANTTLTYSRFNLDILASQVYVEDGMSESFSAKYLSGIEDLGARIDFDFIPNPKHYIRFGASITNHTYKPGALSISSEFDGEALDTLLGAQKAFSTEYSLYAEDDFSIGSLKVNLGVHASAFDVGGKTYGSLQPRIGLRYLTGKDIAIKASFSTMAQFINLLTSESLSLPTDLWVPSTKKVQPQRSWQGAVGVAKTFGDRYEFSVEGFFKQMDQVLSFKEGASFLFGLENDWQSKVTQGQGTAYGLEFFVQKKKGRTSGWIGYTLSWNWRQFDDINGGRRFPFRYDRRHDLSLVISHELSPKITLSSAWIYGTGNAVTLPLYRYAVMDQVLETPLHNPEGPPDLSTYVANNQIIESGLQKNAFRMTDYHRLDLSVSFRKDKPKWERQWIVSIYNAYYHRNPYFILSDTETTYDDLGIIVDEKRVFREYSILPIIPSVAYNFKF